MAHVVSPGEEGHPLKLEMPHESRSDSRRRVLSRCQVSSSHISESTAYQDVRSEMLFASDSGEADARR